MPGGGVALVRALKAIEKLVGANEDQTTGIKILAWAIGEPLRQIVSNAGEDAAVVLKRVREGKGTFGYNAATSEYVVGRRRQSAARARRAHVGFVEDRYDDFWRCHLLTDFVRRLLLALSRWGSGINSSSCSISIAQAF